MTVHINKIRLKSGQSIDVADGLTLVVGPNNAGKSVLLNETFSELSRNPDHDDHARPLIVSAVELTKTGDLATFVEFLKARYLYRPAGTYSDGTFGEPTFKGMNSNGVPEGWISQIWNDGTHRLGPAAGLLVRYLSADGRAGAVGDTNAMDLSREQPSNPLQSLYRSRDLEHAASAYMRRAFSVDLTINRYAGGVIKAHVGRPTAPEDGPPPSAAYINELFTLPLLSQQGDGIKAFMGILFMISTSHFPIVIIDEPEAFLHPPQAELLGQLLAEHHDTGTQVIVATHSADIVRGVTSAKAAAGKVTIVRLTRNGTSNSVAQVPSTAVRELYEDPLIKFYNVLDGLFSQGVVLCEADSDCTYYGAVLSEIKELADGQPASAVSLHFTHCGGKARLPRAVNALRASGVPVVSIVDFDFFCEDKDFNDLVKAHGGNPATMRSLRNDITSAVNSKTVKVKRSVARTEIEAILNGKKTDELSSGEATKIKEAVLGKSGWKEAKKYGRACLSGQAVTSFDKLDAALRELGIFVVPVGELERFHPEVQSDNKATWLREVLVQGKYSGCKPAEDMIRSVAVFIANAQ